MQVLWVKISSCRVQHTLGAANVYVLIFKEKLNVNLERDHVINESGITKTHFS